MTETEASGHGTSNPASAPAVLLETVTPEIFDRNAFRLLGLSNEVTLREVERQLEKAQMQAEFGAASGDGVSAADGMLQPATNVETLREARRRLLDPEQRIVDELFWFWPLRQGEAKSDPGLGFLRTGDLKGALDLWGEASRNDPNAPVARHNLALGWMLLALENHSANGSPALPGNGSSAGAKEAEAWRSSIYNWRLLLEEEDVWSRLADRIRQINDPRLTTGFARRLRDGLPKALVRLHARLGLSHRGDVTNSQVSAHAQLIRRYNFPAETVVEELEAFFASVAAEIDRDCQTKNKEADADPDKGIEIARRVLEEMQPSLAVINAFLPPENYLRVQTHDRIAKCSWGCALAELNKNKNWAAGLEFLPALVEVAASEAQKQRFQDQRGVLQKLLDEQLLYLTCWFCQKERGDKAHEREVSMYGNVQREGRQVRFQTRKIAVPRCSKCKRVHGRISTISWVGFLISGFLGFVALGMIWDTQKALPSVFFGGLAIACGACAIINWIDRLRKPITCKRLSTTQSHPLIKQAINEGWQIGTKPPNTQ